MDILNAVDEEVAARTDVHLRSEVGRDPDSWAAAARYALDLRQSTWVCHQLRGCGRSRRSAHRDRGVQRHDRRLQGVSRSTRHSEEPGREGRERGVRLSELVEWAIPVGHRAKVRSALLGHFERERSRPGRGVEERSGRSHEADDERHPDDDERHGRLAERQCRRTGPRRGTEQRS